ncbi:MAG: single-stranded-DNA-specific exonuclease RecJ [Patescibacteria group bacterium]|nr:single-stranded-DNA-specific exonuclease RecJ [Patescibacteria group bacterium]
MHKNWKISEASPVELKQSLPEVEALLVDILWNRGLESAEAIRAFLSDDIDSALSLDISGNGSLVFYNPFLFRDMQVAVDLIIKHIKEGNKIIVYGDYDADGVTSSAVLSEALITLHARTEVYLPDRVSEGYGLNNEALTQLHAQGAKLIITVDNGIRNKKEVEFAQSLGLDVIITDHHVLPENREDLPNCPIIDPADASDTYPWPFLAGVGVAFKLVSAILQQSKLEAEQKRLIAERSLDLVAVGTIADMVSLLGENRWLVKKGLAVLNQNRRLGLREIFKTAKIAIDKPLESWNVGWQLGPRLNAASRVGHANSAFALIVADKEIEAKELAFELNSRNQERQQITKNITKDVEKQIDVKNLPKIIIGLAQEDQFWNEGVIGLVAGRICEKYHRPTLIITRIVEEAEMDQRNEQIKATKLSFKSSGRSIEGFNLIAAVEECSQYLDKYGGHPMACGFSVVSEEKLNNFREAISKVAEAKLTPEMLVPQLKLDAELDFVSLNLELVGAINTLAPFGQYNLQPRFASKNLVINDIVLMGSEKQHIKLRLSSVDNPTLASFWAIAFGSADEYKELKIGDTIDLAYYLDINEFNGRREVQLKIIDFKKI